MTLQDPAIELSIVIVNHNGAELLAQCLNSLKGLVTDAHIEIYVVDNGFTDWVHLFAS